MDTLNTIASIGIITAIVIGVFFLIRQIVLWYFRINRKIELLEESNRILSKIFIQLGGTVETKSKVIIEDPTKTYDYVDDKGNIRNVTARTAEKAGWTLKK